MRYIYRDGTYIPKHCIYGPRQNEGLVLRSHEYGRITEHIYRKPRQMAQLQAEIQHRKNLFDQSKDMASTWSNALVNLRKASIIRKQERLTQIEQEKLDQYHAILEKRKVEQAEIHRKVREMLFYQKDGPKSLNQALRFSEILKERNLQVEFNKNKNAGEAEKEAVYAAKLKKDAEDFLAEELQKKIDAKRKRDEYGVYLRDFMKNKEENDKEERIKRLKEEQQDHVNMRLEIQRLEQYEKDQVQMIKKNWQAFMKSVREGDGAVLKQIASEQLEEEEINAIYDRMSRELIKERKAYDKKNIADVLARREKMTDILRKQMEAQQGEEEERLNVAMAEKEALALAELERKAAERQKLLADLLESEAQAKKEEERVKMVDGENKKWTIALLNKSQEVDEEWRKKEWLRQYNMKKTVAKALKEQMFQNIQRWKADEEYEASKVCLAKDDDNQFYEYGNKLLEDSKEKGRPLFPIIDCMTKYKKTAEKSKIKTKETGQEKKKSGAFCGGAYVLKI